MNVATKKGFFMKRLFWYALNLQLFSGEGAESAGGETGVEIAAAGQNNTYNGDNEFDDLINGRFKEDFTRKTQAIIDKRFKETKELEAYKSKVSPIVERLMGKYGLDMGEEEKLVDVMETERQQKYEADKRNSILNSEALRNKIGSWLKESEELKAIIPDFNLRNEIRGNKLFSRLLLSGVPVKTAYDMVHKDEIISDAMHFTADAVRQQMVQNIEAKGMRPMENGISSESAIVTSVDVNSLTSQDILKILKQVENGASIKF